MRKQQFSILSIRFPADNIRSQNDRYDASETSSELLLADDGSGVLGVEKDNNIG